MTTYTITEPQLFEVMDALLLPSMKTEAMLRQKDKAYVLLQGLQPNTQWQDLTVQEQAEATSKFGHVWSIDMIGIADAISAKLQEKNWHSHPAHEVKP